MSQSLSRRSFLKYAGSGAASLAAALLGSVSAAAQSAPYRAGEPALLDGKEGSLVAEKAMAAAVPEEFVVALVSRTLADMPLF